MSLALAIQQKENTMINKMYNWMLRQAESKNAVWVLIVVSFIESSFFPFPPDPVLAIVVAKNKQKMMYYAWICTIASVLGGFLGYFIGYAFFEGLGESILHFFNITPQKFQEIVESMGRDTWAFWIICLKGLTPIPFKIVTIASGFAKVDLTVFAIASIIARSTRFIILSYICKRYGEQVLQFIDKHTTAAMISILGIVIIGFLMIKLFA